LIILLTQENGEKKYGIGFYIFYGDGKRVQAATSQNIAHKGDYRPDKTVKEQLKLAPSSHSYVIVPSTFTTGEECPFSIDITSQDPSFVDDMDIQVLN